MKFKEEIGITIIMFVMFWWGHWVGSQDAQLMLDQYERDIERQNFEAWKWEQINETVGGKKNGR